MAKKLLKIISVFLCAILILQTLEIGVLGANEVYFDIPKVESNIEADYTKEITVFSGTHQKTAGRAGTFSLNDFTLISQHTFNAINITSNIYPVDIKLNFNSPEQRFLENVDSINSMVYGDGWLLNYVKLICEVEYSDTREMYLFNGDGNCELFVRAENSNEDAELFPGRQKWVSKHGYSDTVIWKMPDQYIDTSTLEVNIPEQYIVLEETGEISRYDAFGRLREKRAAEGNSCLKIDYVTGENALPEAISKITDGMGDEFRFTYENNKLTKIKVYTSDGTAITAGDNEAEMPLEVNFSYTGDFLTGFTFSDGKSISFTYDADGNMTSAVNIDQHRLEMEYTEGFISRLTEKAYDSVNETYVMGNILEISRDSDTVRTFTDNYSGTQIKTFDSVGNILTMTDENGNMFFDSTTPSEEETSEEEITAEGETTEEKFISLCPCEECPEYECICTCESEDVCICIQCKRRVYSEYDEFGNVTAEKGFDGIRTLISELSVYSSDGTQLLCSTDSSGNTAYYSYDDAGFLKTVTAGSSSGTADYDAVGNLISFSQSVTGLSDGNVMSNSYTYENDKVKTISHNGFTYEFEYDVWGNQTKAKIGSTVLSQNSYGTDENADRLSNTTFANGQTISYSYNQQGNITAVLCDGLVRYSYTYDEEGILQSVTDNRAGLKTLYTKHGTEIRKISDNSILFSVSSDENGNETHNLAGDSITYIYDGEYNSVTGVYTDTVSFENQTSITSDGGMTVYATDADIATNTDWFGRVISKTLSLDAAKDNVTYSIGSSHIFGYADSETTATTKVNSLTSTVTNGTNTVSRQEYYEYDAVGNITGIYCIEENEKIYYNKYYYDEANQIVREDNRLGEFSCTYTYDVGGNIVLRIRYPYSEGDLTGLTPEETHTYSYENTIWGDVLTGYNGSSVTYDEMGNITSFNGDTYAWTAGRQLSRVTKGEDNSYVEYFYDDNGQLSSLAMFEENGVAEGVYQYFWDGAKLIGIKLIETDTTESEIEEDIFVRIIYDADGEALGILLNDALPFLYTKNILGDITGLVDATSGKCILKYIYDAYGNIEPVITENNLEYVILAAFMFAINPLSYRGYAFSPTIGFSYYLGSRFYVPMLCRFMNADVIYDTKQGVVGANVFAYSNNNPVMFIDPDGTDPFSSLFRVFNLFVKTVTIFRAIGICSSYLRGHTFVEVEKYVGTTIVLQYTIKIRSIRTNNFCHLINKPINEWYSDVFGTTISKIPALNWLKEFADTYPEFMDIIEDIVNSQFNINFPLATLWDIVTTALDFYDELKARQTPGTFAYDILYDEWDRYIIEQLKKRHLPYDSTEKMMLLHYIEQKQIQFRFVIGPSYLYVWEL